MAHKIRLIKDNLIWTILSSGKEMWCHPLGRETMFSLWGCAKKKTHTHTQNLTRYAIIRIRVDPKTVLDLPIALKRSTT